MMRLFNGLMRKAAPVLAAGFLLQAAGCQVSSPQLVGGLVTAIAQNLIASVVFGAFNIPSSGGLGF